MRRLVTGWIAVGLLFAGCLYPKAEIVSGTQDSAGGAAGQAGEGAGAQSGAPVGGEQGCSKASYRCSQDNWLERCNAGEFEQVKRCAVGTCVAADGDCTTACKEDGSDCDSGICLHIGTCEPPLLTVKGYVQHWDSTGAAFEKGVEVTATNLIPEQPQATSAEDGTYELKKIPPASLLDIEAYWASSQSNPKLPPAVRTIASSVRAQVVNESDGYVVKTNIPFVPFDWLAQVAVDCGIFPDLKTATGTANINPFWIQRSTIVVEVYDENGVTLAGVSKDDIEVLLNGWSNKDHGENDQDAFPAQICILDSAKTGTQLVGTKLDATTKAGRFVMFRLQNPPKLAGAPGTGDGVAEVRITDTNTGKAMPPVSVSILSSGNIGATRVNGGVYVPPVPRDRTFEGDVYPLLAAYGCVGCHSKASASMMSAGAGYINSKERGPDKVHANYSGTPDEVYAVLMAADAGADCTSPQTAQRICLEKPEASLLLQKPLKEIGEQDHETTAFRSVNDSDYQAVLEWIEQGAPR